METIQTPNRLVILGFYPEALNILLELAKNASGIRKFMVLENMPSEKPEHYFPQKGDDVHFVKCYEQEHFTPEKGDAYVFGVLGTRSKPAVFSFYKDLLGISEAQFINLLHSSSPISQSARLKTAVQIGTLSHVNVLAEIGFGVNIKNQCYIGHHSKIGDFVTLNPGVMVSGFVKIGNNTLIGSGAIIRDGIEIGSNCLIGMGSNVVANIPDNSVAYGNPCKVVAKNG